MEDKCLDRKTEITSLLISRRFDILSDPSGLCRYPLQVAIDNQSTNCYNLIVGMVHELDYANYSAPTEAYESLLEVRDDRDWRAVEHALKYWPNMALHTLPYDTFTHFDASKVKDLIFFAMNNNLLPCIYFLRSLYGKWPAAVAREAKMFILGTILEVFVELEECDSDAAVIFFKQFLHDLSPIELHRVLGTSDQEKLKNVILGVYPRAMERQCMCFLKSSVLYSMVIGNEYLALVGRALNDRLPLVFKALVEAKAEYLGRLGSGVDIDKYYDEVRALIVEKVPILEYSQEDFARILADYKAIKNLVDSGTPLENILQSVINSLLEPIETVELVNTFSFDHVMTAFMNENFIPNEHLRGIFKSKNEAEISALPPLLYGKIPFSLVISHLKPDQITIINREDYFHSLNEKNATFEISYLACYAPETLKMFDFKRVLSLGHIFYSASDFVLSRECRAPEEYKKKAIRFFEKKFAPGRFYAHVVSKDTEWNILSKSAFDTNANTLEVIQYSLAKMNYLVAYKFGMLKRLALGYDILSQFINLDDGIYNIEYIYDMMDLVDVGTQNLVSVKILQDKLLCALYQMKEYDLNPNMFNAVISRLWRNHRDFDISLKVPVSLPFSPLFPTMVEEFSVFKLLLEIGNKELLKNMIKLFSKEKLKISKEDRSYVNSLPSEYKFFADLANDYCTEPEP